MNDPMTLILSACAGFILGMLYFGGLWWTVRRAVTSSTPAILFFTSLLVRMGLVLVGIYYVGQGNWQRIILCLIGFIIGRIVVTRLTRNAPAPCDLGKENSNEA